jgi:3-oxoacyl-[acyl-carrier protein] reductase
MNANSGNSAAGLGKPEELADLTLYLTSDEANFVTDQVCDVAGGLMMT